jgi:hypothetical protein
VSYENASNELYECNVHFQTVIYHLLELSAKDGAIQCVFFCDTVDELACLSLDCSCARLHLRGKLPLRGPHCRHGSR